MQSLTKKLLDQFRYDSSQDVNMRLRDTICRYNGEPVFIRGCTVTNDDATGLSVEGRLILSGTPVVFHSSDELLDVESVPLGWVTSVQGRPFYICRSTKTSQRQGVNPQSMTVWCPVQRDFFPGFQWHNWQDLVPLAEAMTDKVYPIQKVVKQEYGGALNREWALVNPHPAKGRKFFTIYHRSIEVGTYFALRNEFFFRAGRLTKTRRMQLNDLFNHVANKGANFAISEQA